MISNKGKKSAESVTDTLNAIHTKIPPQTVIDSRGTIIERGKQKKEKKMNKGEKLIKKKQKKKNCEGRSEERK